MKKPSQVRPNHCVSHAGFTLIELLTVIAIIAILAGLTAVAVPQYLNKARETQTTANMSNVSKLITAKLAEVDNKNGYPPAYGYVANPDPSDPAPPLEYVLRPYTAEVGIHGAYDVYQISAWAFQGHDLNGDNMLSLFEYQPVGEKNVATGVYEWSTTVYDGSNSPLTPGGLNEKQVQLSSETAAPYVYVPFNTRQLAALTRYWLQAGSIDGFSDPYGTAIDTDDPLLAGRLFFPPPQYDGFVLVGIGPGGTDGGVASGPEPTVSGSEDYSPYRYHLKGLQIAFLATRDLDNDKNLDFDYVGRENAGVPFLLPDGTNALGAAIVAVQ